MAVVRYDYNGVFKIQKIIFKPTHCLYIEVVRRFVQKQYIGIAEQRLRKQNFNFALCVEVCHEHVITFLAYAERSEQSLSLIFGVPTAEFGKFTLKLGGAHAVLLAEVLLGIQRILFVHYLNETFMAEHDGAEHGDVVKCILVLL